MSVAVARTPDSAAEGVAASITRLTLIALFALVVRIAWLAWHRPAEITWDGAEYARIAANIVSGHGYVGMRGMTMFVFPPLYPLAIAALLPLAGDVAQAGLNVSLVSGVAFVFPLYGIAAMCYGRRAGYAAAMIAAVLPFVVELSTVVLADMLFLTLAATGVFFLLRTANERRVADAAGCGVAFALAYLTRPEGVLLELLAIGVILVPIVLRSAPRRRLAGLALAAALPFAVLAAPYVAFLSAHAGHMRIEGKSILNLDIGLRMDRGMSYIVAADAIDDSLAEVGPEIRQDYYFEPRDRAQPALQTILAFGVKNLVRHVREIGHVLISRACGTVLLSLLAVLGFVAGPWTRQRVANQAILLAYGFVIVLSLASVFQFWDRYFVGFVPLLVVWAANGIDVLASLLDRKAALRPSRFLPLVLTGAGLAVLLFSTKVSFADDSTSTVERQAGLWLAQHGGAGSRILSISDQAPFYAHGTWLMLPYAPDANAALRFVRKVQPDYIVLDSDYAAEHPYVKQWLESAVPDARARAVYALPDERGTPEIRIFRWTDVGNG